jgi:molybdenum cofactor guanylyltransferase
MSVSAMDISNITGLVLAGGRGSRMGGVDKGLMPLEGRPMVAHVLARLRPQVGGVLISANRNLDMYSVFGHPVLPDLTAGQPGPLAGIQAALALCPTEFLLTVPCDTPWLPDDLAARLAQALEDSGAELAVAVSGTPAAGIVGAGGQRQPLFCLMRRSVSPALNSWLARGERKVRAWQETLSRVEVRFEDGSAFRNLNEPQDLQG